MSKEITRRVFLKWGAISGAGVTFCGSILRGKAFGALPPDTHRGIQEVMPVSPFILSPFRDKLPIPKAMAPGWRPDPTLPSGQTPWTVRRARFLAPNLPTDVVPPGGVVVPGPALNQQDSYGHILPGDTLPDGQVVAVEHAGTHQVWPTPAGQNFNRLVNWQAKAPMRYHIRLQVAAA